MQLTDYISYITPKHRNKTKYIAWLTASLRMVIDAQNLLSVLYTYFNIDAAIGTQLNTLGVILNTPRLLPFQPSNGVSAIMDDVTYRIVLKAQVAKTQFHGKIQELYTLFYNVLGNTGLYFCAQDNQDMTISVIVYGATTSIIQDLINNGMIIPKSGGVNLVTTITANKIFAFDMETTIFGGFDEGYFLPQGVN